MCKACLSIGHWITNSGIIFYNIAKQQICTTFLEISDNTQALKSSFYWYKKSCKDKELNAKTIYKTDGIIRSMEDEGYNTKDLAPIICIAKAITLNSDSDTDDSDEYKWYG